jgi:hypothetical protein
VQRDVVFLTDELAAMRSYLRDADEERNRHKVTRSRVRHVRDLAYDVDDCLREHAVHLEKPSGWRLARTVLERHRIAEEMKGLRARAEDMNHRNLRYHLADEDLPSANSGKPSSISSAAENSRTLGRSRTGVQQQVDLFLESGQIDLVPLICRNDLELRVIAVWGTSGDPRKTAVIRKAYDDLKRKDPERDDVNRDDDAFESCAWIRVAHPFNPSEFLQCIVRQFYINSLQQEAGKTGEEQETLGSQVVNKMETMGQHHRLVDEFSKHVSQKRYLIVLNELSTIEDWDSIKLCFPNNKKGSRIIVSTDQVEVASLCVGPERLVVVVEEFKQSSTDQVICAFCEKVISKILEPSLFIVH